VDESTVDSYIPTYPYGFNNSFPTIDSVFIELKMNNNNVILNLPYSMAGTCEQLIITDSLTVERVR
ncbi:hypothetical protein, partial [Fulvivirga aurantia]|uniref:hypothetical protein n=1 Tax=Fulvivirga aurantia TaxID=2529383 RepID=UPI001CA39652